MRIVESEGKSGQSIRGTARRRIAIVKIVPKQSWRGGQALWDRSDDEPLGVFGYMQEHPEWEMAGIGMPMSPSRSLVEIEDLLRRNVAGVLVEGVISNVVDFCREHRLPVVATNRYRDDSDVRTVCPDDEAIGRMAAQYFLRRGFRSLAFCGPDYLTLHVFADDPSRAVWYERRLRGFRAVATEAGAQFDTFPASYNVPEGLPHEEYMARSTHDLREWLRTLPVPTGILGCSDTWAVGCLEACREEGFAVPNEMAVMGVDNNMVRCMGCYPALSSIDRNMWRVGYEAAALLCNYLETGQWAAERLLVPPRGVVERLSTDVLAVDDSRLAAALHYIRAHYQDPISLADVARAASISDRSLRRLFEHGLGFSVVDEIRRLRIERTCELLADGDLPLKMVAEASGFRREGYLCHVFSSEMGMSPNSWRQLQRKSSRPRKSKY